MKSFPCQLLILISYALFTAPGFVPPALAQNAAVQPEQDAGPQQIIKLRDGGVIKGQLTGIAKRHYLIRTQNMGTVRIPQDEVYSITSVGGQNLQPPAVQSVPPPYNEPGTSGNVPGAGLQANPLYDKLLADPEILAEIQAIVSDPEIAQVLQDPNLINAVFAMDADTLLKSPRIMNLMDHPKMQRLMEIIAGKFLTMPGQIQQNQ